MIIDKYKRGFISIEEIYFANELVESRSDLTRYSQCKKDFLTCSEFNTLIIDLKSDKEIIEKNFRKNLRNEIRQVHKKHDFFVEFFYIPDFKKINEFTEVYNEIARKKNIPDVNINKIKRLNQNVIITEVLEEKSIIASHLYIFDDKRMRLLYSYSLNNENKYKFKIIASANKFLHSEDIFFAKEKGFLTYDFGGVSLIDKSLAGIDMFKFAFTKEIEKSYNFLVANSYLGKLILFLLNLKNYIVR